MSRIPSGARPAARILLVSGSTSILLLEGEEPSTGYRWWVAPGGGLRDDESFEEAAARELYEETGLAVDIGPWVWSRHHVFEWQGRRFDQYERFFVARTSATEIAPVQRDSYVVGQRWWSAEEIENSSQDFAPRRLGELIRPILRLEYPPAPIDCGV